MLGLVQLPYDGNPHHSMGLIAHPGDVVDFAVSFDGRYLVSAGGADRSVNLWTLATATLAASAALAPIGVTFTIVKELICGWIFWCAFDWYSVLVSCVFIHIYLFLFWSQSWKATCLCWMAVAKVPSTRKS